MALWKTPEKTTLINHIDIKYREIQNCEYQFQVMSKILDAFEIKDLKNNPLIINKYYKPVKSAIYNELGISIQGGKDNRYWNYNQS